MTPWPDAFPRVPDADWTALPLEELALKYDTVEAHGWYANLDRTVGELAGWLGPGDLLLDYSGGTGILADRLLARVGDREVGVLVVDSSPKFLRLALRKLGDDPRVAFRRIAWLRGQGRLERLDEVLPDGLGGRFRAVASTNAVHLYTDLVDTLASWRRFLAPGGRAFVQSGNVGGRGVPPGAWTIDATVEAIHEAAVGIVREEPGWEAWRPFLEDGEHMAAHDELRGRYFLPVRPLSRYTGALEEAGFRVLSADREVIPARVDEWREFLAAYHEGVLGWAGGAEKVTGRPPSAEVVERRLRLLEAAMERVFGGAEAFEACWTYLTAEAGSGEG